MKNKIIHIKARTSLQDKNGNCYNIFFIEIYHKNQKEMYTYKSKISYGSFTTGVALEHLNSVFNKKIDLSQNLCFIDHAYTSSKRDLELIKKY